MNNKTLVIQNPETKGTGYHPKTTISFTITAKEPINCGGERIGTHVPFRKMPVIVGKPQIVKSNFVSDSERFESLMYVVWALTNQKRAQDKLDTIGATRYDFYANALKSSAGARDRWQWLTRVCEKMDILSLGDEQLYDHLKKFNDYEFLSLIRSYMPLITLLLRQMKNQQKAENAKRKAEAKGEAYQRWTPTKTFYDGFEAMEIYSDTVNIPVIPANSIRGIMRRLLFAEFFTIIGLDNLGNLTMDEHFNGKGLEGMHKFLYKLCFTGGALVSGAGEYEDVDFINEMKRHVPVIELLGTAIGTGTIQGCLMPTSGKLKCLENGFEDYNSFYNYLDIQFFTRMDSFKQEGRFEFDKEPKVKKKNGASTQMKFDMEVIVPGTEFEGCFELLKPHSPVAEACLCRGLELLSEYGHIGGSGAKGLGSVDWKFYSSNFQEDKATEYINYLLDNQMEIQTYLINLQGKLRGKK